MLQRGLSPILLILLVLAAIIVAGGVYLGTKDNPDQIFQRPSDEKAKYDQRKKEVETQVKNSPSSNIFGGSASLSNPASEYCIKVGGTLEPLTRGDGGEYSLCQFEDDQACEEWALYR